MSLHRRHPRIEVRVPALLSAPSEGGVYAALQTRELGEGGCLVQGHENIHNGRVLQVILNLGGTPVTALAQVLYERYDEGGILSGLKFLHLEPKDQRALERFIAPRYQEIGFDEVESLLSFSPARRAGNGSG